MTNPFLAPYAHADLNTQTRAGNLFWISTVFSLGMFVLTFFVLAQTGTMTRSVTGILSVAFAGVLTLLLFGQYRIASFVAFVFLLAVAIAFSLINRNGILEGDLTSAITVFTLATFLTGAFSFSSWNGVVMLAAGTVTAVYLTVVPTPPELVVSLEEANKAANLPAWIIIYLLTGFVGALNMFQQRRIIKNMAWAQEIIEEQNRVLEETVKDRTESLQSVLDNTGQGFVTFTESFTVLPGSSRGSVEIFGRSVEGEDLPSLLFQKGTDTEQEFRQGMGLYFQGNSKAAVIFDLMEKLIFVNGRSVRVDYKESGEKRVLVILTDVTLERRLEQKNLEEKARQTLILRALNNKYFFTGFIEEAERLFLEMEPFWRRATSRQEQEHLLRQLHTFKGNAGFFGFNQTMECAHDFEYNLQDSLVLGEEVPWQDHYMDLKRSYHDELRTITELMGDSWLTDLGTVAIPVKHFKSLTRYVRHRLPSEPKLIHFLEHWGKVELRDLFTRFPYIALATAQKVGKRLKPMRLEVEKLRVNRERFEPLAEVCIHLVNNLVDHGIEFPFEREEAGKTPEGELTLAIRLEGKFLSIVFSDDGRGIDIEAVAKIGRTKGLLAADAHPGQVLDLLFVDGFSTRGTVSETSGRGVGLSAVKEEVERMGGSIRIESSLGKGTSFMLLVPTGPSSPKNPKEQ